MILNPITYFGVNIDLGPIFKKFYDYQRKQKLENEPLLSIELQPFLEKLGYNYTISERYSNRFEDHDKFIDFTINLSPRAYVAGRIGNAELYFEYDMYFLFKVDDIVCGSAAPYIRSVRIPYGHLGDYEQWMRQLSSTMLLFESKIDKLIPQLSPRDIKWEVGKLLFEELSPYEEQYDEIFTGIDFKAQLNSLLQHIGYRFTIDDNNSAEIKLSDNMTVTIKPGMCRYDLRIQYKINNELICERDISAISDFWRVERCINALKQLLDDFAELDDTYRKRILADQPAQKLKAEIEEYLRMIRMKSCNVVSDTPDSPSLKVVYSHMNFLKVSTVVTSDNFRERCDELKRYSEDIPKPLKAKVMKLYKMFTLKDGTCDDNGKSYLADFRRIPGTVQWQNKPFKMNYPEGLKPIPPIKSDKSKSNLSEIIEKALSDMGFAYTVESNFLRITLDESTYLKKDLSSKKAYLHSFWGKMDERYKRTIILSDDQLVLFLKLIAQYSYDQHYKGWGCFIELERIIEYLILTFCPPMVKCTSWVRELFVNDSYIFYFSFDKGSAVECLYHFLANQEDFINIPSFIQRYPNLKLENGVYGRN